MILLVATRRPSFYSGKFGYVFTTPTTLSEKYFVTLPNLSKDSKINATMATEKLKLINTAFNKMKSTTMMMVTTPLSIVTTRNESLTTKKAEALTSRIANISTATVVPTTYASIMSTTNQTQSVFNVSSVEAKTSEPNKNILSSNANISSSKHECKFVSSCQVNFYFIFYFLVYELD